MPALIVFMRSPDLKNFALTMRLVEAILGLDSDIPHIPKLSYGQTNISYAYNHASSDTAVKAIFSEPVIDALLDSLPIIGDIVQDLIQNNTCLEIPAFIDQEPLIAK